MLNPEQGKRLPKSGSGSSRPDGIVVERKGHTFTLRKPRPADGTQVWRMVEESSLDSNSAYAYLMWFRYYAESSLVAEHKGVPVGFVSGFRPPEHSHSYFVWQVGVTDVARGKGLATEMIMAVLEREANTDVRYVEATVTPSNDASLALFRGLARKLGTRCEESVCFPEALFPDPDHESELLLRIGPFTQEAVRALKQRAA